MLRLNRRSRARAIPPILRAVQITCEALEHRRLLTSNLFLDFGDNFPVGGLQMSVLQLRNNFGAGTPGLQGPDLRQNDNPMTPVNEQIVDGTNLNFNPTAPLVTFDYNQDGVTNNADYTDLRTAVLSLVQRYYTVFDVNVQLAPAVNNATSADYINGVRAQLQAGANSDGERDSWVFISNITRAGDGQSVGFLTGNFGVSNGSNIGGANTMDNTELCYVDQIFNSTNLAGTDADTRLAYTAAHEAGHDFGLQHTNNGFDNNGNSASGNAQTDADMILQTSSNMVTDSAPAVVRRNHVLVTRFPLVRGDNNVGGSFNINDTVNHYNTLASNSNLGLRAGAPAYITGTGAFDLITLTSGGGSTVNVSLQTHRDNSFSNQIGSTLNYSVNASNGLLIEMGLNADRLVVNADINAAITLRGMNGNDQIVLMGNNAASGSFTPGSATSRGLDDQTYFGGTLVAGGTTIQVEEFLAGGSIAVQDITAFTYRTPNSDDVLTLDTPSAGQMRLAGTSAGVQLLPLSFSNVTDLTIDTATNDGASAGDTVRIQASAPAGGLQSIAVNTGAGDDVLRVDFSFGNPIPTGGISYDGGTGAGDRLVLRGGSFANETYTATGSSDGNIVLDGSTISFTNLAPIDDTVSVANFTFNATGIDDIINVIDGPSVEGFLTTQIGSGNAGFELINFANKTNVTIDGQGGDDTINVLNASLTTAGLTTLALRGSAGDDTINTRAYGVPISVDGGGHVLGDRLNVTGDSLDFDFDNSSFTTATRQPVSYQNIETLGLLGGTFRGVGTITPNVVVDNAATLTGEPTIVGVLSALAGGTVSPGVAGPGIITAGGLMFFAGATFAVDANGLVPGTELDQLVVNGTVSLGGATLDVTLGFTPLPGEDLVLIRNDGADDVVGMFAEGSLATFGGLKFAIDYAFEADNDLNLNDVAMIRYGAALGPDPCNPNLEALFVSASTGDDVIRFVPATGNSSIEVFINDVSEGVFRPSIHGLLIGYGQSGNDLISVEVPSRQVIMYGNVGNDTIVTGNSSGMLLGNHGDDTLIGGNQADILIGGRGADLLNGGNSGDILIAGYTDYDGNTPANRHALCSMLDEWKHGQGGYQGRVNKLMNGGGRNGSNVLNTTTVFDDDDVDTLRGGAGQDWFLMNTTGGVAVDVSDRDNKELVTDLV